MAHLKNLQNAKTSTRKEHLIYFSSLRLCVSVFSLIRFFIYKIPIYFGLFHLTTAVQFEKNTIAKNIHLDRVRTHNLSQPLHHWCPCSSLSFSFIRFALFSFFIFSLSLSLRQIFQDKGDAIFFIRKCILLSSSSSSLPFYKSNVESRELPFPGKQRVSPFFTKNPSYKTSSSVRSAAFGFINSDFKGTIRMSKIDLEMKCLASAKLATSYLPITDTFMRAH